MSNALVVVTITIPGEPVPQGRARATMVRTRGGPRVRMYDPAKSRDWKQAAAYQMKSARGNAPLLAGPLAVNIYARFSLPKAEHRKVQVGRQWHTKRGDVDNIAKAVLDAGNGVVWADDAQISSLYVEKVVAAQGEAPNVRVEVIRLKEGGIS